MAQTAKREQLKPRTVEAFDAYIRTAETEMERALYGSRPFLWSDSNPERGQQGGVAGRALADRLATGL